MWSLALTVQLSISVATCSKFQYAFKEFYSQVFFAWIFLGIFWFFRAMDSITCRHCHSVVMDRYRIRDHLAICPGLGQSKPVVSSVENLIRQAANALGEFL